MWRIFPKFTHIHGYLDIPVLKHLPWEPREVEKRSCLLQMERVMASLYNSHFAPRRPKLLNRLRSLWQCLLTGSVVTTVPKVEGESRVPDTFLHQEKSVHPPQCSQRQAGCSLDSATAKVGGARKKAEHQDKFPAVWTAMLPRLKVLLLERKFGHFGASFHRRQDFPSGG